MVAAVAEADEVGGDSCSGQGRRQRHTEATSTVDKDEGSAAADADVRDDGGTALDLDAPTQATASSTGASLAMGGPTSSSHALWPWTHMVIYSMIVVMRYRVSVRKKKY
uniref:Uncharacterized protein n=1 Tax=Oryza glumipatula TaxID=40148 RepID=A0A0D9YF80_9ORYZ